MSEMKSCWYALKNAVSCSNGEIKYKLSTLLHISYLTENIMYPRWSPRYSLLTAIKNVHTFLNLVIYWEKMWNTVSFHELAEKCANFKSSQKCVLCSNSSLFLFKKGYFKSTIVLEHVWIQNKHLLHTKPAERKVFWLFTEKIWKMNAINSNIKLSCAFGNYRTQKILGYIHVKVDFYWLKYIDITQNLTTQWAIMWDMVNFPEPEEKWAHFTSNKKKHVLWLHNSLFLFQIDLFQ